MARRVFYSFHYKPDSTRASKIRTMGVIEGNASASDNDWESITGGGDKAIQKWIDDQLSGRSCTIVLIGQNTAGRKWINYEIGKSWNEGKGLFGIYIHNLKDIAGYQTTKGNNPFDEFTMDRDKSKLSTIVKSYDPPYYDSKQVYGYIHQNMVNWIEEAISIRENY